MVKNSSELTRLDASLDRMALTASERQKEQWLHFLQLLRRWNKVYNLTSVSDTNRMLSTHLLDSLSIARFIKGPRIADVGSGGGLPGIPLSIAYPDSQFTMIDTVAKKTRFLHQAITELELANAEAVHTRVEDYQAEMKYDQVICRGFSSLSDFTRLTGHLLADQGEWLAMKGKLPDEELAALGKKMAYTVYPLTIPGLDAERHLIQITQKP